MDSTPPKSNLIKNIYFYLVLFVALMMIVFSAADLINIVLRTYVFTKAEDIYSYPVATCPTPFPDAKGNVASVDCAQMQAENQRQNLANAEAQRERDLVRDISMILVGIPLFAWHWKVKNK